MSIAGITESGIQIEQISQALANFIQESMPGECKERYYALMNLEQTMLWYYRYVDNQSKKAAAEERSVKE